MLILNAAHGASPSAFPDSVELKLHVVSARNLRASDIGGTSDPYVKLRVCTARSDAARAEVLELLSEGNVGVGADQHAAFAHLAKKKLWETAAAAKTTIQHKTCQPTWNLDITVCLGLRDVRQHAWWWTILQVSHVSLACLRGRSWCVTYSITTPSRVMIAWGHLSCCLSGTSRIRTMSDPWHRRWGEWGSG